MALARIKFAVGLFVVAGLSMALVALVWLGMSQFLERGSRCVTYFDESVQGLNIDAPVKYRGVPIGRVERIAVAPDSRLIEVVMLLTSGQTLEADMVAQLRAVGITGSVFIELDRRAPDTPDRSPHRNFPAEYPIVPSTPSEIQEFLSGIDALLRHFQSLDLAGISDRLTRTLDHLDQTITDANVGGVSAQLSTTLGKVEHLVDTARLEPLLAALEQSGRSLDRLLQQAELRVESTAGVITRIERLLDDAQQGVRTGLAEFTAAARSANALMDQGTALAQTTEQRVAAVQQSLLRTGQDLQRAIHSLNELVEALRYQPSQLLFATPPEPRPRDATGPTR